MSFTSDIALISLAMSALSTVAVIIIRSNILMKPLFYEHGTVFYGTEVTYLNINGFRVRSPVQTPLKPGQRYYVVSTTSSVYYIAHKWVGDLLDTMNLERGLIHLTKDAAITHAKAILSFTTNENRTIYL